jgi:hypothetical protein
LKKILGFHNDLSKEKIIDIYVHTSSLQSLSIKKFFQKLDIYFYIFLDLIKELDNVTLSESRSFSKYQDILNLTTDDKILIISPDIKWASNLILNEVSWLNCEKNLILTKQSFEENYMFDPSKDSITLFKILKGKKEFEYLAITPDLPSSILEKILKQFSSVDDLIKKIYKTDFDVKTKDIIKSFKKIYLINKQFLKTYYSNSKLEKGQFHKKQNNGPNFSVWKKFFNIDDNN